MNRNANHDARTNVQRTSDRDLVVTRVFDAPAELVYRAWTEAEIFRQWWAPPEFGIALVACAMDVRTGGTYRLEFEVGQAERMVFHGRYSEVVPGERIVWTNDEDEAGAVTTVTFAREGGRTLVTYHEVYPTAAALDEAMQGSATGLPAQFDALGEWLGRLG